ncbi:hypothetical protein [Candidatus Hecatella orcuttiae]|uniref:hypothetical protein n=1 Tax=Candidatus Hecatella orcuttiae TaxID=1935119 RepID=UPI0028681A54|nr:hypothetical protein [Candidatus Hecatella orcuttiae]
MGRRKSQVGPRRDLGRQPTSDVTEALFSVTDAKHFLYCPRIVFFERVLHAAPRLGFSRRKTSGSTGS